MATITFIEGFILLGIYIGVFTIFYKFTDQKYKKLSRAYFFLFGALSIMMVVPNDFIWFMFVGVVLITLVTFVKHDNFMQLYAETEESLFVDKVASPWESFSIAPELKKSKEATK